MPIVDTSPKLSDTKYIELLISRNYPTSTDDYGLIWNT
jgi:hypothetical protein